jgi:transposase
LQISRRLGHEVRLMPPQVVKPYVKSQKNDMADAEAICQTVQRPTMRFVPIKSADQKAALLAWAMMIREEAYKPARARAA